LVVVLRKVPKIVMAYFLNEYYIKRAGKENSETILKQQIINRNRVDKLLKGFVVQNKCETLICENGGYYRPILAYAVLAKSPDIVKLLIKHGANVNDVDSYGSSPIFSAQLDIAKILIENGAKGGLVETYFKISVIESLINAVDLTNPENVNQLKVIILMLINNGAKINHINKKGENVLYISCKKENENLALFLHKNVADADIKVDGKKVRDFCKEKGIELKME